jgi:hypothetical protein
MQTVTKLHGVTATNIILQRNKTPWSASACQFLRVLRVDIKFALQNISTACASNVSIIQNDNVLT